MICENCGHKFTSCISVTTDMALPEQNVATIFCPHCGYAMTEGVIEKNDL